MQSAWDDYHNSLTDQIRKCISFINQFATQLSVLCDLRDEWRRQFGGSMVYPNFHEKEFAKMINQYHNTNTITTTNTISTNTNTTSIQDTTLPQDLLNKFPPDDTNNTLDDTEEYANVLLNDMQLLEEHMNNQRQKLDKESKPTETKKVSFTLSTVDDTHRSDNVSDTTTDVIEFVDKNIIKVGDEKFTIGVPNDKGIMYDYDDNNTLTKFVQKPRCVVDKSKKFVGKDLGSPRTRALNAPDASPLLELNNSEREELYYDLFKQAQKNVKNMNTDLPESELNNLINREADRLLQQWINKRKARLKNY